MDFLEQYSDAIKARRAKLRIRGGALAAETAPPGGQAALWYAESALWLPRSGQAVARQLARLCGDGAEVTIPWRSLADAVGVRDRAGNLRRYTERGVTALTDGGWLEVVTVGSKRGAKTTFRLLPGVRPHGAPGRVEDRVRQAEAA
ncbi:hypothetical protein OKJ48_07885 [Streptomyces kunmingensis]|uniref:Helix-turn-helix domain-containing protein n=1 Tax=Streptomyces kunmingensis TaxID=68225 RepID=A0ABU6C633_9ACTN|nr:hypothetical protein [Streptomyces kunmingensis]MEB3960168.1 hypothetical protein [Streptomyces kunmingensis]